MSGIVPDVQHKDQNMRQVLFLFYKLKNKQTLEFDFHYNSFSYFMKPFLHMVHKGLIAYQHLMFCKGRATQEDPKCSGCFAYIVTLSIRGYYPATDRILPLEKGNEGRQSPQIPITSAKAPLFNIWTH